VGWASHGVRLRMEKEGKFRDQISAVMEGI